MDRVQNDELVRMAQKEEPRFLSILLNDKNLLMDALSSGIKREHFWISKPTRLFQIIKKYFDQHGSLLTRSGLDSILDANEKIKDEDKVALRFYYDEIKAVPFSPEDYSVLKEHINNRYVQCQAYSIIKSKMEEVVNSTNHQDAIVEDLQTEFLGIDNIKPDSYCLTYDMSTGLDKAMEGILQKRNNPDQNMGILTGIQSLDNIYCGFDPGSYTVIAGMVNGGKTTLMLNIAFNAAKAGYNVVYVSIEKEAVPIFQRLLALHALIDYNRIKRGGKGDGGLCDYYYGKLKEAHADLKENIQPNMYCMQMVQGTPLSKILADVEKLRSSMLASDRPRKNIDMVVLDYLGVVGHESHTVGRPDLDLANTSQRFQSYCRRYSIAGVTGVQIKNASTKEIRKQVKKVSGNNKSGKSVKASPSDIEINTEDLAGSQKVIADADNGLSVALNDDVPATKMYVHITKARDSESKKTMVLDFDGKLGRVADPEDNPGKITERVGEIVYSSEFKLDDMENCDGLFTKEKGAAKNETLSPPKPPKTDFVSKESSPQGGTLDENNKTPLPEGREDLDDLFEDE